MILAVKRFLKKNIRLIGYLIFFFIFSILLPIFFFINSENIERELFREIGFLTIISIISGTLVTFLIIIKNYFLYPFSRISLFISIGIQTQILFYILSWVQFWKFEIELDVFYIMINFSSVFIFLCVIPLLFIVRIVHSYIIKYKRGRSNAILLYVIKNGNFSTKNQIRKYHNQIGLKLKLKKNEILKDVELLEKKKLIVKKNRYQLTKKGKEFLSWFEKNRSASLENVVVTPKKTYSKEPLQVWTEEDLKKYTEKR